MFSLEIPHIGIFSSNNFHTALRRMVESAAGEYDALNRAIKLEGRKQSVSAFAGIGPTSWSWDQHCITPNAKKKERATLSRHLSYNIFDIILWWIWASIAKFLSESTPHNI